ERRADARDLVFGLERVDVEVLQRRKLVQNVTRGCDGIATQEQRPPRLARGSHEAERGGGVARDVAVLSGRDLRGAHFVRDGEQLGILREVEAGAERSDV